MRLVDEIRKARRDAKKKIDDRKKLEKEAFGWWTNAARELVKSVFVVYYDTNEYHIPKVVPEYYSEVETVSVLSDGLNRYYSIISDKLLDEGVSVVEYASEWCFCLEEEI